MIVTVYMKETERLISVQGVSREEMVGADLNGTKSYKKY